MDKLVCGKCGKEFSVNEKIWRCSCTGLLDLKFKADFPLEKIKERKKTMWRYREAIPIQNDANIVSFDEGFTPLIEVGFDGRKVLIKQDQLFPTGSFKDRGASVLISKAKELGIKRAVEDSSGNAGCAIAAYGTRAGIECEIFVPSHSSDGKLTQIQLYGAKLNKIQGTREDTANAALLAAEKYYYASHSWNPFFFHGVKTFAFEVCEQLGWKSPDTVILPIGNGSLLLGAYIGLNELLMAGIIDKMPKIIGVQPANCAPLYKPFKENLSKIPKIDKKDTIAEGVAITEPVRGKQIIESLKNSNGDLVIVSEPEIKNALKETCRKSFYIEPTSAATVAGVKKYLEKSNPNHDELIVSVFTGHGLKATNKMLKILNR